MIVTSPYSILGLSDDATMEDAKKAYRKLAMKHHPDRNMGDAKAEEEFKKVGAAWQQIQEGWRPGMQDQPFNPFANNSNMRGGFTSGPFEFSFNTGHGNQPLDEILAAMAAQKANRNRDYNAVCSISLHDAFSGTQATISIKTQNDDRDVTVTIPAGVDSGMRIRVPQAGENVFPQFQPGDLYVTVQVIPDTIFTRAGADLLVIKDIDVLDILVGTIVFVTGIDGTNFEVKVPPSFDPAQRLRVAGQGMTVMQGNKGRGNLYVSVRPIYSTLKPDQIELIEKARLLR